MDGLQSYLVASGAAIVGYADLTQLTPNCRANMPFGISIGIALDSGVVRKIPSNTVIEEYAREYDRLNDRLDELCLLADRYISDRGFRTLPQTTDFIRKHNPGRAQLPHKTVAALSGLGWISKSSLLITPQFGSAVRLTSVLTDMPLGTAAKHTYQCKCGACTQCIDACPGHAIKNKVWTIHTDRDELIDLAACRKVTLSRGKEYGRTNGTCGICVAVCPFTRRHL